MSLIRKHGAVLQAWACLALVWYYYSRCCCLTFCLFAYLLVMFYFLFISLCALLAIWTKIKITCQLMKFILISSIIDEIHI